MRFARSPKSDFSDTARKRAALARKQEAERARYPLLSDHVAAEQPTADEAMAQRAARWDASTRNRRSFLARVWRENRRRLFAIPQAERRRVLAYWNTHRWFPGEAVHFAGFLRLYEQGGLDLPKLESLAD